MSSTVQVGDYTVTSNSDAASMVESLKPEGEKDDQPRIITDKGEPAEKEKSGLSKAASELGTEGAKAAAKARREAIKAKPIKDAPEPEREAAKVAPATEQEPEGEAGDESETPEPRKEGKERSDPNVRVREATREAREAREEAKQARQEAWEARQRLDRIERERTAPKDAPAERQAPQDTGAPKLDDFLAENESYAAGMQAWIEARDKWREEQSAKQYQAHAAAAKYAGEVNETLGKWSGTMKKAAEADPEFIEAVKPVSDRIGFPSRLLPQGTRPGPSNWIADELMSDPDRAPALLRHLSENEDDFQRLAALSSPRAITRELARIEASLDAATAGASSEPPKVQTSKASPPVRPVTGAPSVASGDGAPRQGEAFDDWYRRTNKR